jgi:hypothetical protein
MMYLHQLLIFPKRVLFPLMVVKNVVPDVKTLELVVETAALAVFPIRGFLEVQEGQGGTQVQEDVVGFVPALRFVRVSLIPVLPFQPQGAGEVEEAVSIAIFVLAQAGLVFLVKGQMERQDIVQSPQRAVPAEEAEAGQTVVRMGAGQGMALDVASPEAGQLESYTPEPPVNSRQRVWGHHEFIYSS